MNELRDITESTDEAATVFAEAQSDLAAAADDDVNYPIDETRLGQPNFTDVPCCIYFYYVRINSNGRLFVTHHFYPGGKPDDPTNPANPADWHAISRDPQLLTSILEMMAKDARPSGAKQFEVIGTNFKDIVWQRKSYVAIFIDEASWTMPGANSVRFVPYKNGVAGTLNHSFFDALALPLTMPLRNPTPGGPYTDQRSALVFINHMKRDAQGNDLQMGDPAQLYHFEMDFDVLFSDETRGMRVTLDPDGNNVGPPLPPP